MTRWSSTGRVDSDARQGGNRCDVEGRTGHSVGPHEQAENEPAGE